MIWSVRNFNCQVLIQVLRHLFKQWQSTINLCFGQLVITYMLKPLSTGLIPKMTSSPKGCTVQSALNYLTDGSSRISWNLMLTCPGELILDNSETWYVLQPAKRCANWRFQRAYFWHIIPLWHICKRLARCIKIAWRPTRYYRWVSLLCGRRRLISVHVGMFKLCFVFVWMLIERAHIQSFWTNYNTN